MSSKILLSKSLYGLFVRVASACIGLLIAVIITSNLGAKVAGVFFLFVALLSFIGSITRLGLDNLVVKKVALASLCSVDQDNIVKIISQAAILLCLLVSLIVSVMLYFNRNYFFTFDTFKQAEIGILYLLVITIPIFAAYNIIGYELQGRGKVILAALIQYFTQPAQFLAIMVLFRPVNSYELITLFSISVVTTFFVAIFFSSSIVTFSIRKVKTEIEDLLKQALPFIIILVCSQIMLWGGQIILGFFYPPQEVAVFSMAFRISILNSFILTSVNAYVSPKLAQSYKQNIMPEFWGMARNAWFLMSLGSAFLLILIITFGLPILSYLGDDFIGGYFAMVVMSVGQLLNAFTGPTGVILNMTGNTNILRNNLLMGTILFAVLIIILMPKLGYNGVAIALAVSVTFQNIIGLIYINKKFGVRFFRLPVMS
jgi:O-antigen/teichoic acid export membrane protein